MWNIGQILRGDDRLASGEPREQRSSDFLPAVAHGVFWGMLAGAVVGSYGWLVGARSFDEQSLQIVYSAIKVPGLLAVTVLISLPFFLVLNTLMGLRDDLRAVLKIVVSAQASLAIILCSLTPLLMVVYLSLTHTRSGYRWAILFNALLFAVASLTAQISLRQRYRSLIAKDARHRVMIWAWAVVYAFVGIQVGWTARPFIGAIGTDTTFFRDEPFSNAYVEVGELVTQTLLQ